MDSFLVPLQLVSSMLAMGLTLRPDDFRALWKTRTGLTVGVVLGSLLAPLLALSMVHALGLSPGFAVGLLLVALTPANAMGGVFTLLGRGSGALAVSLTLVSTALCCALMPLFLHAFATHHAPMGLWKEVSLFAIDVVPYLLLPLATGMFIKHVRPAFAARTQKWFVRLALVCLIAFTVLAVVTGQVRFLAYGYQPPLAIFSFALLLSILGAVTLFVLPFPEALAVTLTGCLRNIGLSLLIVPVFFAGDERQAEVFYTCLVYGGVQFLVAVPVLYSRRIWGKILGYSPLRRVRSA